MSIYIIGIVSLLAVFGLLFYYQYKKNRRRAMANYGVGVLNANGQLVDITDRALMISDVINVAYNVSGSKAFNKSIASVVVMANYEFDLEHDGKAIEVTHTGNQVSWKWVPARAVKTNSVSIFVFYN